MVVGGLRRYILGFHGDFFNIVCLRGGEVYIGLIYFLDVVLGV